MSAPPAAVEHHRVDGLAVRRRRPRSAEGTVILVHGAMDRAASFTRVMRRLDELDVVVHDRRGYAGSLAAGPPATVAGHAADLLGIVDWTGAEEVAVVGHSLGGIVALAAAASGDRRADTISSVGAFESPLPHLDGRVDEIGGGAVQRGHEEGPSAAAEHFYRLMVGDDTWARVREGDRELRRSEGPALLAELIDLRSPVPTVDLSAVRCPVLAGAGGTGPPRMTDSARLLDEATGSGDVWTIERGGHGAHLTHPGEFARYVRAVLARGRAVQSLP